MPGSMRGVMVDAPILPIDAKFPGTTLDFTINIPCAIDPAQDFIQSVSLACAPSGAGEMQISGLTVAGYALTFTASGGQPGRAYRLKCLGAMTNGRVFEFVAEQHITPELPDDQPQPAPSRGFGTPITWAFAPSLNFSLSRNSSLML